MRLVSTLTADYTPALAALLCSLARNAGRSDLAMTVILYGPIGQADRDLLAAQGVPIDFAPKEELGHFEFNRMLSASSRMRPNFDKVLMWRLPYDEVCLYVDADVLCLNPLTDAEKQPHLGVVVNQSQVGRPLGYDRNTYKSRHWIWNAGVMFFKPSLEVFDQIQQFALTTYRKGPMRFGDQIVQNDFFSFRRPSEIHYLDLCWNTVIRTLDLCPYLIGLDRVKLLHYADPAKPWCDPPRQPWQEGVWKLWQTYRVGG